MADYGGRLEEKGIVTLVVIGLQLIFLVWQVIPAEIVVLAALCFVWQYEIIDVTQALSGFSNEGMITVGIMFIVIAGVQKSRIADRLAKDALGAHTSKTMGLLRLQAMSAGLSMWFNNTPLVALMLPITRDWARARGYAPSAFLIPLSFSVIAGGMMTIIGTSTNLIVNGLLVAEGEKQFAFFDPLPIALPCTVALILFLTFAGPYILPQDKGGMLRAARDKANDLVTEISVLPNSPFVGQPIDLVLSKLSLGRGSLVKIRRRVLNALHSEEAALKKPTTFNIESARDRSYINRTKMLWYSFSNKFDTVVSDSQRIERESMAEMEACTYVDLIEIAPMEEVRAFDTIFLAGRADTILQTSDFMSLNGLKILDSHLLDLVGFGSEVVELLIGDSCPFLGKNTSDSGFAHHYNVAVLAVRPRGHEDVVNVGDVQKVELAIGDVVLALAKTDRIADLRKLKDFYVVTTVGHLQPPPKIWDYLPVAMFIVMLCLVATEYQLMVQAALTVALVFILGGWVTPDEAFKAVDFKLLALMGASISFAKSISASGVDDWIAKQIEDAHTTPTEALWIMYFVTCIITEMISNNSAAAMMMPIVMRIAARLKISVLPLAMAVMQASTCGYLSPIGYQTHLMVWAPGGYTFMDFVKPGLVCDILWMVLSCSIIPHVFPFDQGEPPAL